MNVNIPTSGAEIGGAFGMINITTRARLLCVKKRVQGNVTELG